MREELLVGSGQWLVGKDGSAPDRVGVFLGLTSDMKLSLIGHHAFSTHHSPLTTHGAAAQ